MERGLLRALLLDLIGSGVGSGTDLRAHITERNQAGYRPSAGAIVPRLHRFLSDGLIEERDRDSRKIHFGLTLEGRDELKRLKGDVARARTVLKM